MLRARLREIAQARPRWGWRKAYWVLRSEGHLVNRKRIRRYWPRKASSGRPEPARGSVSVHVGVIDWSPVGRMRCGHWTSRSTSPPMVGRSGSATSWTSSLAKPWRPRPPGRSPPMTPPFCWTRSSPRPTADP
ncbi:transposase [Actinophytocola sp. S1-96]|uniref:Transposase n=1 Tax=Actinophytocola gossypii TaxID=2812003 RepID=A0ABT2J9X6_9PSEU|nr:transposase [Actinophytocola gossypii]